MDSTSGVSAEELPALKAGILAVAADHYFARHGDDMVQVKLIDLVCVIARLRQVHEDGIDASPVVFDRIFTCDLPRLERYLPAEAIEAMG
jgi:hypothetical protein